jgi:outer membrane protein OmpA-like peptidoglycan-associated protein
MNKKVLLASLLLLGLSGCAGREMSRRETGALGGGALGAGLGAIIGHETGHTGAGVAIGAAMGAVSGGLIGNEFDNSHARVDQNEQLINERQREIAENQKILDELRARGADVRSSSDGVVVNLPDVLFEFDSSKMMPDARLAAREIATVVNKYPARRISVEGHTDSVGTVAYNKKLSTERAQSVARELEANGVGYSRILTYGYGEGVPIASNSSEYGRKRNRRVEVIIKNN